MGREEGGGFRMGNTCIIIFFKLKLNKKIKKKKKKTTQIHSFIVLMDKSWKSRCQKDYTSSERSKGDFILASSAASVARQSLIVVASYLSLPLPSQNLLSSLCTPHKDTCY